MHSTTRRFWLCLAVSAAAHACGLLALPRVRASLPIAAAVARGPVRVEILTAERPAVTPPRLLSTAGMAVAAPAPRPRAVEPLLVSRSAQRPSAPVHAAPAGAAPSSRKMVDPSPPARTIAPPASGGGGEPSLPTLTSSEPSGGSGGDAGPVAPAGPGEITLLAGTGGGSGSGAGSGSGDGGGTGSGSGGGRGGSGSGSGSGVGSGSGSGVGAGGSSGSSGTGGGGTGAAHDGAGTSASVVRPAAKSLVKPAYPDECRRRGQEGKVVLRVLVGADGSVAKVEVATPSGVKAFDRAAADGAKRWRFEPARRGDKPVEAWMKIPVIFRLED